MQYDKEWMDSMDLSWISMLKNHLGRDFCFGMSGIALVVSICYIKSDYGWAGVVASVLFLIVFYFVYRDNQHSLSSTKWFDAIAADLDDATEASIYLRQFVHPDYFDGDHRQALMNIMKLLARGMAEHPDSFRIIAYRSERLGQKDPRNWLRDEIAQIRDVDFAQRVVERCIRIVDRQPSGNSSTIYLIDGHVLIYNRRLENRIVYSKLDLSRSILPQFIKAGMLEISDHAPV